MLMDPRTQFSLDPLALRVPANMNIRASQIGIKNAEFSDFLKVLVTNSQIILRFFQ
jgi:hypothetical protein